MRIYSASSEETLRARQLLTDWAGEGFLTSEQQRSLEKETIPELRTTNIFLRVVLFLFTLIIVGAAVGLFFVVFLSRSADATAGVFFLIFAGVCYAAAEAVVSKARLYRYGIEEALAACSVGFLCMAKMPFCPGGNILSRAEHRSSFPRPAHCFRSGSGTDLGCGMRFPPR